MNPRDGVGDTLGSGIQGSSLCPSSDKPAAHDCTICGRNFSFLSSLSQHMRMHTGSRPYKCPYCPHRASQKGNLKVHIRSHKLSVLIRSVDQGLSGVSAHPEGMNGSGTGTGTSSSSGSGLVSEGRGRALVRNLVKREKRERGGGGGMTTQALCCRLCGYAAQREDQLLSHIEKVHIVAEPDPELDLDEDDSSIHEVEAEGNGEVFGQSHLEQKQSTTEYSCGICGRVFSQPWFLKSHMRTHNRGRAASRARPKIESEPLTINNVPQYPESGTETDLSFFYEVCSDCGHIFHSCESLKVHATLHGKGHRQVNEQVTTLVDAKLQHQDDGILKDDDCCSPLAKKRFTEYLCLQPVEDNRKGKEDDSTGGGLGRRVPELNPVYSVQAWQLANRRHVSMGDASDTADRDNSTFTTIAVPEKRTGRRSSSGAGVVVSWLGDESPEHLSDTEYLPGSRTGRRASSAKSIECFQCGKVFQRRGQLLTHLRTHHRSDSRNSGSSDRSETPCTPGEGADEVGGEGRSPQLPVKEEKTYQCDRCNYITSSSPDFLSHVHHIHIYPSIAANDATLSKLQPAGEAQETSPPLPSNLCTRPDGPRGGVATATVSTEPPLYHCPLCSHATFWPELLWVHQFVAHKTPAGTGIPKQPRGIKPGRRRTGPPPILGGQDCPPLPSPASSRRTRPPTSRDATCFRGTGKGTKARVRAGTRGVGADEDGLGKQRMKVGEGRDGRSNRRVGTRAEEGAVMDGKGNRRVGEGGDGAVWGNRRIQQGSDFLPVPGRGVMLERRCPSGGQNVEFFGGEWRKPVYVQNGLGYQILPRYAHAVGSYVGVGGNGGGGGDFSRAQGRTVGVSLASPRMTNAPAGTLGFLKNYIPQETAAMYRAWRADKQQMQHIVSVTPQQKGLTVTRVENISSNPAAFAHT